MNWPDLVSFADAPFEIIDGDRGKNYPKQSEYNDSGYCLFLSATNVTKAGFDFSSCQFIDEKKDAALNKGKLQREDIVLTTRGTIGNAAYFNDAVPFPHLRINSGMVILRCDRAKLLPAFLYHFVRSPSFYSQVNGLRSGVAQPQLPIRDMRQIRLPLPRLPIQQHIAGILSSYDELIENSQRRIKILESMARALYREWFVHFCFPGHENHSRVASALGEIPLGWEVKELGDVCSKITDGSHFSPPSVADGYPMASVKDMHDWGIDIESCRRIAKEDYENLIRNDCKPQKNDILIAKDGSYLKHTFVVGDEQDLVLLSSIAILRPNDIIRPNYLCLVLRDPVIKARMKGIVSGVAIPRIVLKDFRKFQIVVPPLPIQTAWAKHVDPLVEMCRKLVSQTENLRRTRDLLLPRLLSGQVKVEAA